MGNQIAYVTGSDKWQMGHQYPAGWTKSNLASGSKLFMYTISTHLPCTPNFSDQFSRLDAIIRPLQTGQFENGLAPLSTTADIGSALTPWHFLSSVTTPEQGSILLTAER
jgi:hypothetical protein